MARLFIIGNGYDIAHGFSKDGPNSDSSYFGFKKWLIEKKIEKKYHKIYKEKFDENSINLDKTPHINEYSGSFIKNNFQIKEKGIKKIVSKIWSFLYWKKDDKNAEFACAIYIVWTIKKMQIKNSNINYWKDFEETLGILDIRSLFDELKEKINVYGSRYNVDRAIPIITDLFNEWINSLKIKELQKTEYDINIIKRINENDYFINFNYTETLEKLFGENKNIYHIHGYRKNGSKLIVGHGNKKYSTLSKGDLSFDDVYKDIEYFLYKDTKKILAKDETVKYFNRLKCSFDNDKENEILSFGLSFGDVDMAYIRVIKNLLQNCNLVWKLCAYDKKTDNDTEINKTNKRETLEKEGFVVEYINY